MPVLAHGNTIRPKPLNEQTPAKFRKTSWQLKCGFTRSCHVHARLHEYEKRHNAFCVLPVNETSFGKRMYDVRTDALENTKVTNHNEIEKSTYMQNTKHSFIQSRNRDVMLVYLSQHGVVTSQMLEFHLPPRTLTDEQPVEWATPALMCIGRIRVWIGNFKRQYT